MTRVRYLLITLGLSTTVLAQAGGIGSVKDLSRLLQAQGDAYIELRAELLKTPPGPWDVEAAAALSWEHAVLAFALNQRLRIPEAFARWDENARRPLRDHAGRLYRFDIDGGPRSSDIVAFLVEQAIKPPDGIDAQWPMGELLGRLQWGKVYAGIGDPAMWRAIWKECPHERLREAALFFLASSGDARVLPIVAEVLRHDGSANGKRFKSRCLSGIVYSDSEEAKKLVIEEWPRLKADSLLIQAIGVLLTSSNPRARELIYAVALDSGESPTTRLDTIRGLAHHLESTDRIFLDKFFAEVKSDRLKADVLTYIDRFPFEWYREPVREILKTLSDRELKTSTWVGSKTWTEREIVRMAALALMRGHGAQTPRIDRQRQRKEWTYDAAYRRPDAKESARRLDVDAWEEDMALLKEVVQRDNLPQDLRDSIARRLEDMYELRRRSEKQRQGD